MKHNSKAIEKTLHYWDNVEGSNCARSTACGLLSAYGKEDLIDPLYAAMLPAGGGFGERSICGAVTGTLSGLSIILTEKLGEKAEFEEEIKEEIERWKEKMHKKFKTLICGLLLEDFEDSEGNIDVDQPERRNKCTDVVKTAVTLAQEIIDKT